MRLLKTDNRKISVDELNISDAYQRTVVAGRVNKIVKALDQDAFGSLTVGVRKDGTYWVVDGMQRLTAARRLGIATVPCDVFESDGPKHEARVFRLKNKERTNVSPMCLFKAQLTEGDEQSTLIAATVRKAGLKIGYESSWPYIKAVKALERSFGRVGEDGLLTAMRIIATAWPGEPGELSGEMVEGMCWFIKKNVGFDEQRLIKKLSDKAVSIVVRSASATHKLLLERDSGQYGRALATCDAITAIYMKGMRRKKADVCRDEE